MEVDEGQQGLAWDQAIQGQGRFCVRNPTVPALPVPPLDTSQPHQTPVEAPPMIDGETGRISIDPLTGNRLKLPIDILRVNRNGLFVVKDQ
jgi:hypothetical protein